MIEPVPHFRRAVLACLALGAILATWSELWFYRVDGANLFGLWLIYAASAGLVVTGLAAFGVRRPDGLILAAALFGFVIEGVPTTVLYEAPPFSFLWTSLAWHATMSFGLGVVLYRYVMGTCSWPVALALNLAIGVALGGWNLYSWTAISVPGSQAPIFRWVLIEDQPGQFLLGYVLLLIGHLVLDLLAQSAQGPAALPRSRLWFGGLVALALVLWGMDAAMAAYPWSLSLPVLAGLCIWGMARHGGEGNSPVLNQLLGQSIPLPRYILSLTLPLSAILTVTVMADLRFGVEANAWTIVIAGPVALVLTLRALARGLRRPS